jgi:TonB family protein
LRLSDSPFAFLPIFVGYAAAMYNASCSGSKTNMKCAFVLEMALLLPLCGVILSAQAKPPNEQKPSPATDASHSGLDVLSDTMGVDFGPYLARVLHDVRENWFRFIPDSARAPQIKKGKVSIELAILKDGQVAGLQIVGSSGDVALDRAAYGGITASKPFLPLPAEFGGKYIALRVHFYYNPSHADPRTNLR